MATGRKLGMHGGVKPEELVADWNPEPKPIDETRQAFIDQAAIALHAHAPGVKGHFQKAVRLWDERQEWLKTQR